MIEAIKTGIKAAIPDAEVHAGSPYNDDKHFEAIVISPSFEGKTLIQQHKAVMMALKESFDDSTLHALALKTFSPEKWEQSRADYNL